MQAMKLVLKLTVVLNSWHFTDGQDVITHTLMSCHRNLC